MTCFLPKADTAAVDVDVGVVEVAVAVAFVSFFVSFFFLPIVDDDRLAVSGVGFCCAETPGMGCGMPACCA